MKTQGQKHSKPVVESTPQAGQDAILERMKKKNRPMNRETYLAMMFPDGVPAKLSPEIEASLPDQFQL